MLEVRRAETRLHRRLLPILLILLAVAGGILAWRILADDLRVYDGGITGGWLCGGGGRWDCNAVAVHESAWLFGLPLSLWGLLFYIVVFGLALGATLLPAADRKAMARAGAALGIAAVGFDLYLGYVMVTQIGSLCGRCLSTYAINVLLAIGFIWLARALPDPFSWRRLFPSWPGLGRTEARPGRAIEWMKLGGTLVLLGGLVTAFVFGYSSVADSREFSYRQLAEFLESMKGPPEVDMRAFAGRPSRGPADAPVTVVLVGDFQCTFCRALAASVEVLRERYPDRIREVFINAPIDSDCNPGVPSKVHPRACWLAQAGVCARRNDKFWEFHDLVFLRIPYPQVGKNVVLDHMREIGIDREAMLECADTRATKIEVAKDIELVNLFDLTTPSLIINGTVQRGGAPRWMVERMVAAALGDSTRQHASAE